MLNWKRRYTNYYRLSQWRTDPDSMADQGSWYVSFKGVEVEDGLILSEWMVDYCREHSLKYHSESIRDTSEGHHGSVFYRFVLSVEAQIEMMVWKDAGVVAEVGFELIPGDRHWLFENIPELQELLFGYLF